MEKRVEIIQVPREFVKYIAKDGTEFGSEEECKKYEDTAECAIRAAVECIATKKCGVYTVADSGFPYCYDGIFRAIKIRNVNDVEIVNKWILATNNSKCNCVSSNDIGRTLIFEEYDNWINACGDIDEMVQNYRRALEKHLGEETQEEK